MPRQIGVTKSLTSTWVKVHNPSKKTIRNFIVHSIKSRLAKDCLYEHREHTEFIAFGDWDDLFVTPDFRPLPPVFTALLGEHPDSASLVIQVHHADLWKIGLRFHLICISWVTECIGFKYDFIHIEDVSATRDSLTEFWRSGFIYDRRSLDGVFIHT
jgi:hypothetical protein